MIFLCALIFVFCTLWLVDLSVKANYKVQMAKYKDRIVAACALFGFVVKFRHSNR